MSGDFYVFWKQEYYVPETEILKFEDCYENLGQKYEGLENFFFFLRHKYYVPETEIWKYGDFYGP